MMPWTTLVWCGALWLVLAILAAALVLWALRRRWPICVSCGHRADPDELHLCAPGHGFRARVHWGPLR